MINKEKTCMLIDVATPDNSNVNARETEKLSKCQDLWIEVSRMWKGRIQIGPVIIGALGTITKGLDQNLQLLPGHLSALELQKITLMRPAHIIRNVLGYIALISC